MTVRELIDKLEKLDPNLRVFVNGYEGGYEDVSEGPIQVYSFKLNANDVSDTWWLGPHDKDIHGDVEGVVL